MERAPGIVLLFATALTACGGRDAPSVEVAALSPGNAAVVARLEALPAPPLPWSRPMAELTEGDFEVLCPYLREHASLEGSETTCADGSVVRIEPLACEPEPAAEQARALPCSMTIGEAVACRIALMESPCEAGSYGENLEACRAYDACICSGQDSAGGETP